MLKKIETKKMSCEQQFFENTLRLHQLRIERESRYKQTSESMMLITGNSWYWDTAEEEKRLIEKGMEIGKNLSNDVKNEIVLSVLSMY